MLIDQGFESELESHALAESHAREHRNILHDLRQPVSVIRVLTANIRRRCIPTLDEELAQYLAAKLAQLDDQAVRLAEQIEKLDNLLRPKV